jgi:hypothetical protein
MGKGSWDRFKWAACKVSAFSRALDGLFRALEDSGRPRIEMRVVGSAVMVRIYRGRWERSARNDDNNRNRAFEVGAVEPKPNYRQLDRWRIAGS